VTTIDALSDTHSVIWYIWDDPRLSAAADQVFDSAVATGRKIGISSMSLVEMVYLIEKRKIHPATLQMVLDALDSGELFEEVTVTRSILPALAAIPRSSVPDMPDRIIAATAAHLGVPLVTRDRKIRASSVTTIW